MIRQPSPCRHIRNGYVNDGTGLCDPCKKMPVPKTDVKRRRELGLKTGPR